MDIHGYMDMDVDLDVGGLDMPDYLIQSNPFGALGGSPFLGAFA